MDRYLNKIICGDCLEVMKGMPDNSIYCCVTSPPYWGLRDYGLEPSVWGGGPDCTHEWGDEKTLSRQEQRDHNGRDFGDTRGSEPSRNKMSASQGQFCIHCGAWLGCFGLEPTPELYVEHAVMIFREIKRVLRDDGTLWLNLGDSYISKDLVGIPWRVAFALQADGWYLRSDIIWHKPNPMPESVKDRPTKAHEYIFLLSKSQRYCYDYEAIKEKTSWPGEKWGVDTKYTGNNTMKARALQFHITGDTRNKRTVWTVATKPFKEAHFATFPTKLIEPCILAGCPDGGIVLDPFMGAATTAIAALEHRRQYIGIELNPEYCAIANERIRQATRQEKRN